VGGPETAALTPPLDRLRRDFSRILRGTLDALSSTSLLRDAHDRGALDVVRGREVFVVAAGKAALPLATAFVETGIARTARGVVAGTNVDTSTLPTAFSSFNAGHPDPDEHSVSAARAALACAAAARAASSTLVCLLSGGASAMLASPVAAVPLADKATGLRRLMNAGVPIEGLNCVRKHLSTIKGGRLGAAAGTSLTLALSDVHSPIQDDPSVIGSGPTMGDPTTFAEAMRWIEQAAVEMPASVLAYLRRGQDGTAEETIKPGDVRLKGATFVVIGNRWTALDAAKQEASRAGYEVVLIDEPTGGEARVAAAGFTASARRAAAIASRPLCVIAAGETTVRVVGDGRGGRNQEFALASTRSVASLGRAALLASVGTDGIDGPTDAAGAIVDSGTLTRAERAGVDWRSSLAANDAYSFFEPLGDLVVLGPTGTNVGDLHVLLIA
jgi:glycerate 2-kinase